MRRSAARDTSAVERFRREATAVQRIDHPAICGVNEIGWLPDGRPYAVMERLRGETLKARLSRGPLGLDEIAAVIGPIARALQATHAHGIVHRDLKPENVFLSERGGARLLDFGIAQFSQADDAPGRLTGPGFVVGTPNYISPEQAQGRDQTAATDVYGLGVVLFEMLTGRLPFEGKHPGALLSHHLLTPAPRVSDLIDVPAHLDDLVARMLAKAPADRPSLDVVCAAVIRPEVRDHTPRRATVVAALAMMLATAAGWWTFHAF